MVNIQSVIEKNKSQLTENRIYDADPKPPIDILPGLLPGDVDPPLSIPTTLPTTTLPSQQERYEKTPIYDSLTTNVPDVAMSFSDVGFGDGPFVKHDVPCRYLQQYVVKHDLDEFLVLNTTVEDVSRISGSVKGMERWRLMLRRFDKGRGVDEWWEEEFDAVVFGNGHYSIPFVGFLPPPLLWFYSVPRANGHDRFPKLTA